MKKIKLFYWIPIISISLMSCMVSSKPNQGFFKEEYKTNRDAEFVSVNVPMWITKPAVRIALKDDPNRDQYLPLIKKVKDVKILTATNIDHLLTNEYLTKLQSDNFEQWMLIKKDSETVNIFAKSRGDAIKNLIIAVNSEGEFVFIDVKGSFTPEDISQLITYAQKNEIKSKVPHTN